MTEMHKQANRMTFAEIEEDAYQDSIGFSLGQLGKSGTGRIRAAQVIIFGMFEITQLLLIQ